MQQFCFDFVLEAVRTRHTHRAFVRTPADGSGSTHGVDLDAVFEQAQFVEQVAHIAHIGRCLDAAAALRAHGIEGVENACVLYRVVAQCIPECRLIADQFGELCREQFNGAGFIEAEGFARCCRPITKAIPYLSLGILLAAEQYAVRLRVAANHHDEQGVGFGETGQVMKVAIEAICIFGIAIATTLWRRGDDGDTSTGGGNALGEARAASGDGGKLRGGWAWHGGLGWRGRLARVGHRRGL